MSQMYQTDLSNEKNEKKMPHMYQIYISNISDNCHNYIKQTKKMSSFDQIEAKMSQLERKKSNSGPDLNPKTS